MNDLLKEWKKLAKAITKYDKMYEKGESLISDNLYDSIYERLVELEEIIGPQKNSPTNKLISNNLANKVAHLAPMLSLEHGFGIDFLQGFLKRAVFPLIAEHKVDGVSIALRYDKGELKSAITRGNGEFGNEIIRQIKYLDIPRTLDYNDLLEVRGELYLSKSEFEKVKDRFSSPRNSCASIIQNKNVADDFKLAFFVHNCISSAPFDQYSDLMSFVASLGFEIVPNQIMNNAEDCKEFFAKVERDREQIPYTIDGVVFKINNLNTWKELGNNRKSPRYAFAVKFDPISKDTTIEKIIFQVGKFGTITPVAIFETINIDGHNISKATLHNIEEMSKNGYGPGDKITVSRSGDVVPYIKAKIYDAKNPVIITKCPSCGSELEVAKKSLKCPAGWSCIAQRIEKIEHFCSRNAFNIDGIGPKGLESLIEKGHIYYPSDLFKLPDLIRNYKIDLTIIENWNSKSADNLINSIERARKVDFANFLHAICIPNVGFGHSKTLANHFSAFNNFINYYRDKELDPKAAPIVAGIGPVIEKSIQDFVNNPEEKWVYGVVKLCEISV